MIKRILLILISLALLIGLLMWRFPYIIKTFDEKMRIIQISIIISILLSGIARYRSVEFIKSFAIWISIITLFLLIYINKNNLKSTLLPNQVIAKNNESLILNADEMGHFFAEILINDQAFNCLIDTGASQVTIGISDAKALNILEPNLNFDISIKTANGYGRASRYKIDSFQLGKIKLNNFPILINKEDGNCLIGMSFLKKLRSFTFEGNNLIIIP